MRMNNLMKQAQKMQAQLAQAQEEIAEMEVENAAGGGMVVARMNGAMELLSLKIDPDAVDPDEVETLEDLILAAVNGAIKEVRTKSEERMAEVTGGAGGMPGIPGLPF